MTESEWLASEDPAAMLVWRHEMDQVNPPPRGRGWGMISDRKLLLWVAAVGRKCPGWKGCISVGTAQSVEELAEADRKTIRSECYPPGLAESVSIRFGDVDWSADFLRDIVGNPFRPVTRLARVPCSRCRGTGQAGGGNYNPTCTGCNGLGWHEKPHPWLTPTVLSLAQAAYDERLPDGTLDPFRLALVADALEEAGCPPTTTRTRPATVLVVRSPDGWVVRVMTSQHYLYLHKRRVKAEEWLAQRFDLKSADIRKHESSSAATVTWAEEEANPILAHLRSPGPRVRGCHVVDSILGRE